MSPPETNRRTRTLVWGVVGVVAVVAVVVAVVASSGGGSGTGTTAQGNATVSKTERAPVTSDGLPLEQLRATGTDPEIGTPIPTLTGVSVFDGAPVKIAPNGMPQLVVFVAHWCPHCQLEVPRLVSLAKDGVFDGVTVTAVATATDPGAPNYPPSTWLKRVHWPYPVLADSVSFQAARAWGLDAYPFLVFVDAQGKVAGRLSGEVPPSDLEAYVAALKAGKKIPIARSGASSAGK